MNIYNFIDDCREYGLTNEEAIMLFYKTESEERESFLEYYNNRHDVQYGWHQQDVIDMYRREQ